jgi:demethylmenaquinone methyltransferase/2-methoxy-6-polyprenyl-1,4-benzoquinol methylase
MQTPSREGISEMFDQISGTYDRINRVMTFGLDQYWRKKMAALLPKHPALTILDCATGTGDQIICLMEGQPSIQQIVGIDLSEEMLRLGRKKLKTKSYGHHVTFQQASALELPFADQTFDVVTISFGIRNVTNVSKALTEFRRVLKPAGRVMILEATIPTNPLLRPLHLFYLRYLLPRIGGWLSKKREAYSYLNQTIETFPAGEAFCLLLQKAGFKDVKAIPLTGGVVSLYLGTPSFI